MPIELVKHPNTGTVRMIHVPDTPSQSPITPEEDLILALAKRVNELVAENLVLKCAESDLRAYATLCRESAKNILGLP